MNAFSPLASPEAFGIARCHKNKEGVSALVVLEEIPELGFAKAEPIRVFDPYYPNLRVLVGRYPDYPGSDIQISLWRQIGAGRKYHPESVYALFDDEQLLKRSKRGDLPERYNILAAQFEQREINYFSVVNEETLIPTPRWVRVKYPVEGEGERERTFCTLVQEGVPVPGRSHPNFPHALNRGKPMTLLVEGFGTIECQIYGIGVYYPPSKQGPASNPFLKADGTYALPLACGWDTFTDYFGEVRQTRRNPTPVSI